MEYVDKKIPEKISSTDTYPDGANCPTTIDVHKCFCGAGEIEHHYIRGFADDYYIIRCKKCKRKHSDVIDRIGDMWRVYLK